MNTYAGHGWIGGSLPPDPNPNSPDGRTRVLGEPAPMEVRLLDGKTRRCIDSQRSKPDGTWLFTGLNEEKYYAIEFVNQNGAYSDTNGQPYNSFIQDFIYPMPGKDHIPLGPFWGHVGESATFDFDGDQLWDLVVSLLPMNGPNGSVVVEDVKPGHTWIVNGGAHISDQETPLFGDSSLSLNGVDAYLRNDTIAEELSGLDSFTIEVWVMKLGPGTERGFYMSFNTSSGGNTILIGDGQVNYGSNAYYFDEIPMDNQWHHCALVFNEGNYKLFFDGQIVDDRNHSTRINPTDRFSLGQEYDNNNPSNFFEGNLGYFRAEGSAVY